MAAWPFLISRSRDVDYQVILAPDFLVRKDRDQLLKKVLGSKAQEIDPSVKLHSVTEQGFENLRIAYRTDVAAIDGKELHDRAGRRILRVSGLVFQGGDPNPDQQAISRLFKQADQLCDKALLAFWQDNAEKVASPSSQLESGDRPRSRTWIAAAIVVAISALLNVLFFLDLRRQQAANRLLFEQARGLQQAINDRDAEITRLRAIVDRQDGSAGRDQPASQPDQAPANNLRR